LVSTQGLKFTTDDFISINENGEESSSKKVYALLNVLDPNFFVSESITFCIGM